jgi:hypothetical protein
LKSHFATSSLGWGGRRKLPCAFTEHEISGRCAITSKCHGKHVRRIASNFEVMAPVPEIPKSAPTALDRTYKYLYIDLCLKSAFAGWGPRSMTSGLFRRMHAGLPDFSCVEFSRDLIQTTGDRSLLSARAFEKFGYTRSLSTESYTSRDLPKESMFCMHSKNGREKCPDMIWI